MLLPFGVTGFLMLTNPAYLTKLTQSLDRLGNDRRRGRA